MRSLIIIGTFCSRAQKQQLQWTSNQAQSKPFRSIEPQRIKLWISNHLDRVQQKTHILNSFLSFAFFIHDLHARIDMFRYFSFYIKIALNALVRTIWLSHFHSHCINRNEITRESIFLYVTSIIFQLLFSSWCDFDMFEMRPTECDLNELKLIYALKNHNAPFKTSNPSFR